MLGKIALLEEIEGLLLDDPSLEFFLPFILEDLVLAYSLGTKGDLLLIPGRLYHRRVATTPILKDNLVGDQHEGFQLTKNCFNQLSAEIVETTKQVIDEYRENPITRRTLEMFSQALKGAKNSSQRKQSAEMVEDEEELEESLPATEIIITISKKGTKIDPKQADLNLKAYEDKVASVEKEVQKFNSLIKKFDSFHTRYRRAAREPQLVIGDQVMSKSFSYTAQERILEMKLEGKHIRLLNRLKEPGNQAAKLLMQLRNTIQTASGSLHLIKSLPEAHQVKVHDIMDVIVRAVDLEEEVLETYVKLSTMENLASKDDLGELIDRSQSLWEMSSEIETNKKYQMRKEAVELELKQAEADLASRMDKIRSRIYMSYNKSKMIAKQIYMLRARAGHR